MLARRHEDPHHGTALDVARDAIDRGLELLDQVEDALVANRQEAVIRVGILGGGNVGIHQLRLLDHAVAVGVERLLELLGRPVDDCAGLRDRDWQVCAERTWAVYCEQRGALRARVGGRAFEVPREPYCSRTTRTFRAASPSTSPV